MKDLETLAAEYVEIIGNYFAWWDMPDEDDFRASIMEMLATPEGCRQLISELLKIIKESEE